LEARSWGPERPELQVDPGWSFTAWIGLDQSVAHDELERRRKTARLGTLVIPVKVEDEESQLTYRV